MAYPPVPNGPVPVKSLLLKRAPDDPAGLTPLKVGPTQVTGAHIVYDGLFEEGTKGKSAV